MIEEELTFSCLIPLIYKSKDTHVTDNIDAKNGQDLRRRRFEAIFTLKSLLRISRVDFWIGQFEHLETSSWLGYVRSWR